MEPKLELNDFSFAG
jgi:hypothetical protein